MNFGLIYFHRIYRLIPTLLLFICLMLTFYIFMSYGPVWHLVDYALLEGCRKYWWTTVLFVNNFYPPVGELGCLGPLWYLSNDMLFFMFLPFVILAYINKRAAGYLLTWMIMIACIISTFTISAVGKHPITTIKDSKARTIYHQPWTRYGAYTVGILFGMMYYEFMRAKKHQECSTWFGARFYNKVFNSRGLRWSFYFISSFIMVFLI